MSAGPSSMGAEPSVENGTTATPAPTGEHDTAAPAPTGEHDTAAPVAPTAHDTATTPPGSGEPRGVAVGFETEDRHDRRLALTASGRLAELNAAGLIEAADVHVARRLTEIVGEEDELVTTTLALLVRAVREGSTSLAPAHAREVLVPVLTDLPDDEAWLARLEDSAVSTAGVVRVEHGLAYLDRYHREERQVAEDLARRRAASVPPVDVEILEAGLARVFADDTWQEQRDAVRVAASQLTTVLAGGPGTGKTSTVAGLLTLLLEQAEADGLRIALAAPTGKAAARLRESVVSSIAHMPEVDRRRLGSDIEAVTIHRLLGWRPDSGNRFRRDRGNPLPHDIIVVDEASMLSLTLTARLLEALRPSSRLLLVGDPDQLASVEAGAVLADLVAGYGLDDTPPGQTTSPSPAQAEADRPRPADGPRPGTGDERHTSGTARTASRPVVRLRTSHRFGQEIGALAEAVRVGDADEVVDLLAAAGEGSPVRHLRLDDVLSVDEALRAPLLRHAADLRELALAGRHADALRELGSHRLLCAHREGPWGVRPWNDRIERWLSEATGYHGRHVVGRPLLVTANDRGLGLFNGDTGVMSLREDGRPAAAFGEPDSPVVHPASSLAEVETAYAMTIHKSQGSQARSVTVLLPEPDSRLLTRELLYTAITRAQESVTLVGTEESVRAAVGRRTQRATGLRHRL